MLNRCQSTAFEAATAARGAESRPKNAMISPNRIMGSMFSMNFAAENLIVNPVPA